MHPKIDVNVSLKNGSSPLYVASCMNHPQIVEELLKAPCIKLNAVVDKYNETALCIATAKGYLSVVLEFLKHPSVDVNFVDSYGYSPLLTAAEYGFEDIVQALLKHPHVNVNLLNKNNDSALVIARTKGYIGIEKLIVSSQRQEMSLKYTGKATMFGATTVPLIDVIIDSTNVSLKR